MATRKIEYDKTCFVIMPFGTKKVGKRKVDFDDIYERIFKPAIKKVKLPEGGTLIPMRADEGFFSADIDQEMFQLIEYSRIALTDISGLNANVFYELGARHRARESATAVFRQAEAPIPFDINKIRAFPYEYEPANRATKSRKLIRDVLTESLQYNRMDSPVQKALKVQHRDFQSCEQVLHEAENAIRNQDRATAIVKYRAALDIDRGNPLIHMKLGLLLKDQGSWADALEHFDVAVASAPDYSEGFREKGIAENKLAQKAGFPTSMPDGSESLRRAIELNPNDFDAMASLGGVLKRQGDFAGSLEQYRRATEVSNGHSYPLLNEIKLQARIEGAVRLQGKRKTQLIRVEPPLRAQVANQPPYNPPWSFFDLAEVRLYLGDGAEFLKFLRKGLAYCTDSWQADTFRESLQLLVDGGVEIPELETGIADLREAFS